MITPLDLTGTHTRRLRSYVCGEWVEGTGKAAPLVHAVTGATFAEASTGGIDFRRTADRSSAR